MNNDRPVEDELFRNGEPAPEDAETLLAHYRLFVGTSEALAARRQVVNTFFLSVTLSFLQPPGCSCAMINSATGSPWLGRDLNEDRDEAVRSQRYGQTTAV